MKDMALNPAQREAVAYLDSPLLVLAGAGSGKTRVIAAKIAHLIDYGFLPEKILALTFTNKAAQEMRERVRALLAHQKNETAFKNITICTFHALGLSILRAEREALHLKPRFSILDPHDLEAVVSELVGGSTDARALQWQISQWKNALITPELALKDAKENKALLAAHAYSKYDDALLAYQAVDLDDLIVKPVRLFAQNEEARARWAQKFSHVLIDEYQDTNPAQYELLKTLVGNRAFTAVGDDDQAIYGWRGATIENVALLPKHYASLKVIKLEQNYRSSIRILKSANALISHNPKLYEKKLWSDHGIGDIIRVIPTQNDEVEAETVARRLTAHKLEHRTKFSDYAILYRGNFQSRIFENALRAHQIPYIVSGGQSFFDYSEIKDLVAYLRLIANDDDDPSFIRAVVTPKRGVGHATLERLGAIAAARHESLFSAVYSPDFEHTVFTPRAKEALQQFCAMINQFRYRAESEPAGRLLDELIKTIGFEAWLYGQYEKRDAEKRFSNVRDFIQWLAKKGEADHKNLLELTQLVMLISMIDEKDEEPDAVRLSTLHAAKGLEFPHVFLVGVEEGILPHRESIDANKVEEERRLMYVGITRAQRSLTISYCKERKRAGEKMQPSPSRFISEMVKEDLQYSDQPVTDPKAARHNNLQRIQQLKSILAQKKTIVLGE
jgi:ATP-dependent DNA helicase Rep